MSAKAASTPLLPFMRLDPSAPPLSTLPNNAALSFLFFTLVSLLAYHLPYARLLEAKHSKLLRVQFTNRVAAFVHAVAVVLLGSRVYLDALPQAYRTMSMPVSAASILTHDVAFGYFLYDFVFMALFEPNWLYFCHHIGSLGCIGITRLVGSAHWITATAILFGELTNPLQLPWEFARIASKKLAEKKEAAMAKSLKATYEALSLPYTVLYVLCRIFYAPGFMVRHAYVWYTRYGFRAGGATPLDFVPPQPYAAFVYTMVFITIAVSLQWAQGIVKGYLKYSAKKRKS